MPSPTATAATADGHVEPAAVTAEPVEVRTGEVGGVEVPVQLILGSRLWLVRDAVPQSTTGTDAVERWRVRAGDGASGSVTVFVLVRLRSGRWWRTVEPA